MYYTYMWSLVIAKDLFSRFDGDLMNTATANDYRESVLAPGGSRDAVELVREFLGRDYGFSAFESWLAR
jgi:thimet oligopeptidase